MSLARRIAASVLCALPLAAAIALLSEPRPAPAQIQPGGSVLIDKTPIVGGTSGRCLYDNAGKIGETASCGLAGAITVGTSVITGGTNTRVLYDNAGVLGEYTAAQVTALINVATASLSGALPAWPNNTTTFLRGDGTYATLNCAALTNSTSTCTTSIGTSGATIPLLSTTNTWSLAQTFTAAPVFTDQSGSRTALGLGTIATVTSGTGVNTALAANVGSAGAFVVNGGALGTPSSGTATNITGLPVGGISGLGTGVGTALGIAVGSAGGPVINGGALGTPSSATLTNATGLPTTGLTGPLQAAQFPALTGDVTTSAGALAATIASAAVTNAKLANMATTTIKGQTVGGSGAPVDLTATQAATILATVGGVLKSNIVATSYDLSTASGTQTITGCGFTPTAVIVLASKFNSMFSVGIVDSASHTQSINQFTDAATQFGSNAILDYDNTTNTARQTGSGTLASDGLSIVWTKTGAPSGTLTQYLLCLR